MLRDIERRLQQLIAQTKPGHGKRGTVPTVRESAWSRVRNGSPFLDRQDILIWCDTPRHNRHHLEPVKGNPIIRGRVFGLKAHLMLNRETPDSCNTVTRMFPNAIWKLRIGFVKIGVQRAVVGWKTALLKWKMSAETLGIPVGDRAASSSKNPSSFRNRAKTSSFWWYDDQSPDA